MVIKELGERLFVFQFVDNMEKERVVMKQPWFFKKSLLILEKFDEQSKSKEVELQWFPFWVQVHSLPLELITEKIGKILGNP